MKKSTNLKITKPLLLSLALVCTAGSLATASAAQKYTLKGAAPTGTFIKTIDATSSIPFDKKYFELTQEQRTAFRARFDNIGLNQIPPFPVNGMKELYRPLIDANDTAAKGTLSLSVVVDESGQVSDLKVLNAPNERVAQSSAAALRKAKFTPAYCEGAPCKMSFPVQIKFI